MHEIDGRRARTDVSSGSRLLNRRPLRTLVCALAITSTTIIMVDVAPARQANAAKATEDAKVQVVIDKARGLITENKFADASSVLQQLTGLSLSADQAKLVDSLKEQIQKALAAKTAENAAAGNLLKQ